MYEIFAKLLEEKGVTRYQVSKATGVPQSSLSDWSKGKSTPKYENMKKLAEYFGVTVEYLTSGKKEKPTTDNDDELNELFEELKNRSEMRMLFSVAKGATKEDVIRAARIVEAALGK